MAWPWAAMAAHSYTCTTAGACRSEEMSEKERDEKLHFFPTFLVLKTQPKKWHNKTKLPSKGAIKALNQGSSASSIA
jgi:hypothetical protein